MLKKLGEWEGDKYLYPGDTVSIVSNLIVGDEIGASLVQKEIMVTHEVKKEMRITQAALYQFEYEFDLKEGYAGVIGNND